MNAVKAILVHWSPASHACLCDSPGDSQERQGAWRGCFSAPLGQVGQRRRTRRRVA